MVKRDSNSETAATGEFPASPTLKRPKLSKEKLYKPPTSEELATLKETQNLYQSSLFRLQMQELISEVKLPDKRKKNLTSLLHSLNGALTSLPEQKIADLSDTSWLPEDIKVPIQWTRTQIKGQACFQKPTTVKVVGSFLVDACFRSDLNVDIAVEIPTTCLHQKDYLNFRYQHKRALYCAYLVKHLRRNELIDSIQYGLANGNRLRPIVILRLADKSVKNVLVKLLPCLPPDSFKASRLLPSKSNIRKQWYSGHGNEEDVHMPTPIYNTSLLADMHLENHLHHLYNTSLDFQGFKDGMYLLKVWLHQRELDKGTGTFSGFIMSMLVAYLLSERKLYKVMSGYQVMRNTLLYLASSIWTKKGITLCQDPDKQDFMGEFHQHFDVVFIDSSGFLNLCANMTAATYARVKHEAQLSMACLDNKAVDAFDILFMTPVPFIHKFDHTFHIHDLEQIEDSCKQLKCEDRLIETGNDYLQASLPGLIALLQKALGNRIHLLGVKLPESQQAEFEVYHLPRHFLPLLCRASVAIRDALLTRRRLALQSLQLYIMNQWPVSSRPTPAALSSEKMLTFGLLFNNEFATSILDKGPAANSPEATAFREFWGERSELRRFQDTSICEAVVWPGVSLAEKRLVCQHVVKHVLQLHAGIAPSRIIYTGGRLDYLLAPHSLTSIWSSSEAKPKPKTKKTKYSLRDKTVPKEIPKNLQVQPVLSGEEDNVNVIQAYTTLGKRLRKLNKLPLTITSVQGVSAVFRYAEVFPPIPVKAKQWHHLHDDHSDVQVPVSGHQCPDWVPALKVVCYLEGSGQWPNDLEAIKRIKAAFHIRMAELLQTEYKLVALATTKYVDVMQDGYIFRVEVAHRREIALMKESLTPLGVLILRDNAQSLHLERETVQLPRLTSMLHGLQQQHNTFSNTVRLAKRWVCAHLLSNHMQLVCLELIVAYLYLQPLPFTAPSTPMAGFMRFLHLLSSHDWNRSPLIVNLNNELTDADYEEIREHFRKSRAQLPIMFLATPIDKLTSVWTQSMPTLQIVQRLVILAKESLQVLQTQLGKDSPAIDTKQIFRPPLDAYDVIIHLRNKLVPRWRESIDAPENALANWFSESSATGSKIHQLPVVNFDPVNCYINDLQALYGEMALFFHDIHGGDLIAVLWKPTAFKPQPFKVKNAQGKIPKESHAEGKNPDLIPNVEAIVADFQTLGQGLVKSVEVRTDNIEKWM